jgi:hypothetical protein
VVAKADLSESLPPNIPTSDSNRDLSGEWLRAGQQDNARRQGFRSMAVGEGSRGGPAQYIQDKLAELHTKQIIGHAR